MEGKKVREGRKDGSIDGEREGGREGWIGREVGEREREE